jgi:hypothetical protein
MKPNVSNVRRMKMPKIDLCFQGWLRGAEINNVTVTATGEYLDVSECNAEEITNKLAAGEWTIALGDHLYDSDDAEIEVFDFTAET